MTMLWKPKEEVFFLFLLVGIVSGMNYGSSPLSKQMDEIVNQLTNLRDPFRAQLIQLEEQVEMLQQENIEDKERIANLEQARVDLDGRVSLLESDCGSSEMETERQGSLMAIGGCHHKLNSVDKLNSAEVLNSSCNFNLPMARTGSISVTTTDGKTLVCGGDISNGIHPYMGGLSGPTSSCLQFNYDSQTWEPHSPLSIPRVFASVIELKRGVYVLGGEGEAHSSIEFLATGSSVWTQGPYLIGRGVCGSCAAKLSDTEFVILGGDYDGTQAIVYSEDTESWTEWPRLTENVYGHHCLGLGDTVLMAGGQTTNIGRTLIFDSKTGSAREVASLKYPRRQGGMVLHRGKVVILGGYDGRHFRNDGEIWNMDTETWEEADISLNIKRTEFSLVNMAEEIHCD